MVIFTTAVYVWRAKNACKVIHEIVRQVVHIFTLDWPLTRFKVRCTNITSTQLIMFLFCRKNNVLINHLKLICYNKNWHSFLWSILIFRPYFCCFDQHIDYTQNILFLDILRLGLHKQLYLNINRKLIMQRKWAELWNMHKVETFFAKRFINLLLMETLLLENSSFQREIPMRSIVSNQVWCNKIHEAFIETKNLYKMNRIMSTNVNSVNHVLSIQNAKKCNKNSNVFISIIFYHRFTDNIYELCSKQ